MIFNLIFNLIMIFNFQNFQSKFLLFCKQYFFMPKRAVIHDCFNQVLFKSIPKDVDSSILLMSISHKHGQSALDVFCFESKEHWK